MKNNLPNYQNFKQSVKDGWLSERYDEDGNYVIFNYKPDVQYKKHWTRTCKAARGIIFDVKYKKCVARSFPKFFNYGEVPLPSKIEKLTEKPYEVVSKEDGSLILLYFDEYKGELRAASRGSLDSPQAKWANEVINSKWDDKIRQFFIDSLQNDKITPVFELIHPENRIVVNYGQEHDLRMLQMVDKYGKTAKYSKIKAISDDLGIKSIKFYGFSTFLEVLESRKELNGLESEGYVVRFDSGLLIKIKGEEYLTLHKLRFGQFTNKYLFKIASFGQSVVQLLAEIAYPDEFAYEVLEKEAWFVSVFEKRKAEIVDIFKLIPEKDSEKEYALYFRDILKDISLIGLFLKWQSGENIDEYIWKMLKKEKIWQMCP